MCKERDVINQYLAFTKIYNEQVKLHGSTRKAVLETIRICKAQNVLGEHLSGREKEVVDMGIYNEQVKLHGSNMSEPKLCLKQDTKIPKNMKKSTCLFCM